MMSEEENSAWYSTFLTLLLLSCQMYFHFSWKSPSINVPPYALSTYYHLHTTIYILPLYILPSRNVFWCLPMSPSQIIYVLSIDPPEYSVSLSLHLISSVSDVYFSCYYIDKMSSQRRLYRLYPVHLWVLCHTWNNISHRHWINIYV